MNDYATYDDMPTCHLLDGRVNPEYSAWYRRTKAGKEALERYWRKHRIRINERQRAYQRRLYFERLDAMTGSVENPVRIQRRRTKGWRMPENTIYVGRPTIWGNPFGVHPEEGGKAASVQLFREWLDDDRTACESARRARILENLHLIRGVNLACFCALEEPCHADVYLEVANG